MKKDNGQIILAMLAGASAGIMAGILLSPDKGVDMRNNMKRKADGWLNDMNQSFSRMRAQLQGGGEEEEHVLHGSWDDVKDQLREVTEEDDGKA